MPLPPPASLTCGTRRSASRSVGEQFRRVLPYGSAAKKVVISSFRCSLQRLFWADTLCISPWLWKRLHLALLCTDCELLLDSALLAGKPAWLS